MKTDELNVRGISSTRVVPSIANNTMCGSITFRSLQPEIEHYIVLKNWLGELGVFGKRKSHRDCRRLHLKICIFLPPANEVAGR